MMQMNTLKYKHKHIWQIGFGISVTQGYGLVVTRQRNMPSGWCESSLAGSRAA